MEQGEADLLVRAQQRAEGRGQLDRDRLRISAVQGVAVWAEVSGGGTVAAPAHCSGFVVRDAGGRWLCLPGMSMGLCAVSWGRTGVL